MACACLSTLNPEPSDLDEAHQLKLSFRASKRSLVLLQQAWRKRRGVLEPSVQRRELSLPLRGVHFPVRRHRLYLLFLLIGQDADTGCSPVGPLFQGVKFVDLSLTFRPKQLIQDVVFFWSLSMNTSNSYTGGKLCHTCLTRPRDRTEIEVIWRAKAGDLDAFQGSVIEAGLTQG